MGSGEPCPTPAFRDQPPARTEMQFKCKVWPDTEARLRGMTLKPSSHICKTTARNNSYRLDDSLGHKVSLLSANAAGRCRKLPGATKARRVVSQSRHR